MLLVCLCACRVHAAEQLTVQDSTVESEIAVQEAEFEQLVGQTTDALNSLEQGGEQSTATLYLRSMLLLETGDVESAATLLEELEGRADAPQDTPLFLAIALLHAGQAERAEQLAQKVLDQQPQNRYANYLLGVALAQQDRLDEADTQLERAGVSGGSEQFRLAAHRYSVSDEPVVDQVSDAAESSECCECDCCDDVCNPMRRLHITVLSAIDYDTNVPSTPDFTGLGANFNEQEDARYTLAMFGDWLLVDRPNLNGGLIFSTFDSWHFDSSRFNIQDYMGGAYSNFAFGYSWMGSMRYEYHDTMLGNHHLASEHRVTPGITYLGYDWGHTTFYYEFDTALSNAPALIPQQIQSGNVQSVGVTQAIYTFGGDGRIFVGYRYENAEADGADFDRISNMVTGRFERPVYALDVIWDAEIRHFWDDYKNPNSLDFFRRQREDTRVEVRSGVQKNLTDHWATRFDYTYLWRNSNVENLFGVGFYDYDRHIFSTQLIYDF